MKKLSILIGVAAVAASGPAFAHHVEYLDVPFDTRGACEAQTNSLSNNDDWLLDAFPALFSSEGDVRSFLVRAFPCERRDGEYYITDHRVEVLGSDWFQRR